MSAAVDLLQPKFRQMRATDIPQVLQIEQASYSYPWSDLNFRDCLKFNYLCNVLEYDSKVIAYSICQAISPEAHILNLCVHPKLRRNGFARLMLDFIQHQVMECKAEHVYLEVRPSNTHAISLYLQEGFARIGVRKNYYPNNNGREDATIMSKRLPSL